MPPDSAHPDAPPAAAPAAGPESAAGPPDARDAVAELTDLSKAYYKPDGSIMVEALRGIDVQIGRGEYVAIMGASGSGKSTLMNILGCLDRPTGGRYLLAGRDIREMTDEELSLFRGQTIGFVFQAFNLIPQLTVEENVEVPLFYQGVEKGERRSRAIEKLGMVGLGDRLGHRPRELSGGQQQRVAIARSLVADPKILMADEPTGNLDSRTGEEILQLFESLHARGMTIIMVTHDDSVADRCERVIRLRDGLVETDRWLRTRSAPDVAATRN
ncbi:MAG: ABC transporter ATP-binding protein [Planctomycetota bacterium]